MSPLANTFQALPWTSDRERHFNERFLVSLGFIKVRETNCLSLHLHSSFRMNKPDVHVATSTNVIEHSKPFSMRILRYRSPPRIYFLCSCKTLRKMSVASRLPFHCSSFRNDRNPCLPDLKQQLLSAFKGWSRWILCFPLVLFVMSHLFLLTNVNHEIDEEEEEKEKEKWRSIVLYLKIRMFRRLLINPLIVSSRFVSQYYSKKKILVPSRLG